MMGNCDGGRTYGNNKTATTLVRGVSEDKKTNLRMRLEQLALRLGDEQLSRRRVQVQRRPVRLLPI